MPDSVHRVHYGVHCMSSSSIDDVRRWSFDEWQILGDIESVLVSVYHTLGYRRPVQQDDMIYSAVVSTKDRKGNIRKYVAIKIISTH